jgi:PAS domain S-box-containing protein
VANLSASLARVLATRRADDMAIQKYDIPCPEGGFEERWWSPRNIPVLSADGAVRYIIHQVEDVTAEIRERQRAADAEAGEARLKELADAIPGLVFETDAEGRYTYVNEQYRAYAGLSFAELLGEGWQQVVHPDDREKALTAWREAIAGGQPVAMECHMRRADGAWRWFLLRITAIRNAAGRVEKGIGVCTDIDDAKRSENELRAREEQFRTMADSLPQLAWIADAQGWIYWYNRRWYEYTGTTLDQMAGWGWRSVHHPEHVDRVVERIQHAWDTGEPWEDTFPLRGADGQYRWFLSHAEPIRDANGRVIRWFGTNTDITERQKREDFQKLLIEEISHRVKNSLALVSALLSLQARTVENGPRAALEDAASRVHAVATVHDQLWRQADAREIDLAPFLSNLGAALATTAPHHATIVDVEPAVVSADMAVPIGLFVNELVTNAYKHGFAEGEKGEVRIAGARMPDGRYQLDVSDTGRGLPADFDLERSRSSLGIRVITSLAKRLDGELSAERTDPGARFTLRFPVGHLSPGTKPQTG